MSAQDQAQRLSDEVDDLLRTMWALRANDEACVALGNRLADVLVHQAFVELRLMRADNRIDDVEYFEETSSLLRQCRAVGIVPLSSTD